MAPPVLSSGFLPDWSHLCSHTCALWPRPLGRSSFWQIVRRFHSRLRVVSLFSHVTSYLVFVKVSLSSWPRSFSFPCVFPPLAFLMLPCFSCILVFYAITLSTVGFFYGLWHIKALTLFGSKLSGDRTVTFRNASLSFLCKHNYTVAAVVAFLPLLLPPFKERSEGLELPPPPNMLTSGTIG